MAIESNCCRARWIGWFCIPFCLARRTGTLCAIILLSPAATSKGW